MNCTICEFADAHGWWGPTMSGKTHCLTCHTTWGGTARAHCTVCHQTFASNGVADKHWRKAGHVHPSEIVDFWQDEEGFWHYGGKRPLKPAWVVDSDTGSAKPVETILAAPTRVITGDWDPAS